MAGPYTMRTMASPRAIICVSYQSFINSSGCMRGDTQEAFFHIYRPPYDNQSEATHDHFLYFFLATRICGPSYLTQIREKKSLDVYTRCTRFGQEIELREVEPCARVCTAFAATNISRRARTRYAQGRGERRSEGSTVFTRVRSRFSSERNVLFFVGRQGPVRRSDPTQLARVSCHVPVNHLYIPGMLYSAQKKRPFFPTCATNATRRLSTLGRHCSLAERACARARHGIRWRQPVCSARRLLFMAVRRRTPSAVENAFVGQRD